MALRKIYEVTDQGQAARVYCDSEWQEYRVRSYSDGKLLAERDYFTDNKEDAFSTADTILKTLQYQ